jgi:hypothetical protein
MKTKEEIIAKIQEACPELMKLEFGCNVFIKNFFVSLTIVEDRRGDTWIEEGEQNADFIATVGNHIQYFNENHITEILGKEPHLEHLLRTMSPKRKDFTIRLRLYENPMLRFESVVTETRTSYDLTLSVEENLNNKELCEFIHSLICE